MANIAMTNPNLSTGALYTLTAAAGGGDTVPVNCYLFVQNAGGSPITVTVNSIVNCSQGFDHDITAASVVNGTTRVFGPLGSRFDNGSSLVSVTYSGVTSVSVAALPAPPS